MGRFARCKGTDRRRLVLPTGGRTSLLPRGRSGSSSPALTETASWRKSAAEFPTRKNWLVRNRSGAPAHCRYSLALRLHFTAIVYSGRHDLSTCLTFLDWTLSTRRLRRSLFGSGHSPAPAFLSHLLRTSFLILLATFGQRCKRWLALPTVRRIVKMRRAAQKVQCNRKFRTLKPKPAPPSQCQC
jgi:hypothetical protein